MIDFGGWPNESHCDYEQVKRIDAARKLKKDILSLDRDNGVINIQGSAAEPYEATLYECTCPDFKIRQAPCKHIYCLALELGLLDDTPVYKKGKSSFNAKAEIERYKDLYLTGEINADTYVKLCTVLGKIK
ncbi:MAG: SWIM zinc finger family protein [Lachnospiraceae bacterium]|nr:SWIM zinc finger family protein [Lachnospiraceae bacterium]